MRVPVFDATDGWRIESEHTMQHGIFSFLKTTLGAALLTAGLTAPHAADLRVPLEVNLSFGRSWADAK